MVSDHELLAVDTFSVISLKTGNRTKPGSARVASTTLDAVQTSALAYGVDKERDLGRYSGNLALGSISVDPLHVEPWKLGVSYSFVYAHPLTTANDPPEAVIVVIYLKDAKNPDVFDEFVRSSRRGKQENEGRGVKHLGGPC